MHDHGARLIAGVASKFARRASLSAALVLAACPAFAAPRNVTLADGNRVLSIDAAPARSVSHRRLPHKGAVIFSNLAMPYDPNAGWTISGSAAPDGQIWLAEAFTTTAAATAREIDVAVGWYEGSNGITVGLCADAGGVPGTKLDERIVKNLSDIGSSDTAVGVAKLTGVPLAANTRYWVTITMSKRFDSMFGAWYWTTESNASITAAQDTGKGWVSNALAPAGAFAVYD